MAEDENKKELEDKGEIKAISTSPSPDLLQTEVVDSKESLEGGVNDSDHLFKADVDTVKFGDLYEIHIDQPIDDFTHSYADAYAASELKGGARGFVAIVIRDRYPIRSKALRVIKTLGLASLMEINKWGTVYWPSTSQNRFVIIMKLPAGEPLVKKVLQQREPMSEEIISKNVIPSIALSLRGLSDRGVYHGSIRPDNIFMIADDQSAAVLGECVSAPPGALQPARYETIPRACCEPIGRGAGAIEDEIYALGVTVAILLLGHNPTKDKTVEEVVKEKIARGSYAIYCENLKPKPDMAEFLRGTLIDDPNQRWSIDQLMGWVEGKRMTPRRKSVSQKANRGFEFNGKKYYRIRNLARAFKDNPRELVTIIENKALHKWISRSLGNQERTDALEAGIKRAASTGNKYSYEHVLLSHVTMALDPTGPIYYKDLAVLPRGFSSSMVVALVNGKDSSPYEEFIKLRLGWYWHGLPENIAGDTTERMQMFEACQKFAIRSGLTMGFERCIYELNPNSPCLSPRVEQYYVYNCRQILLALNHEENPDTGISALIDPHIVSFIIVRDDKDHVGIMNLIQYSDRLRRNLAVLTLFYTLQSRLYSKPLPNLAKRFVPIAHTVVERYKSLDLVERTHKNIEKIVKKGHLDLLMQLIDDPIKVREDEIAYLKAVRHFSLVEEEKQKLRKELENNPEFGKATGREIASIISIILSGIIIAIMLMLKLTGDSGIDVTGF